MPRPGASLAHRPLPPAGGTSAQRTGWGCVSHPSGRGLCTCRTRHRAWPVPTSVFGAGQTA